MEQSSNGTSGVYNKLDSKEREQLAILKGSPVYKTLIKAIDIYQKDKAIMTISTAPNWENVVQNKGEIMGSSFPINLINYIALKQDRAEKAKEAIAEQEKNK